MNKIIAIFSYYEKESEHGANGDNPEIIIYKKDKLQFIKMLTRILREII